MFIYYGSEDSLILTYQHRWLVKLGHFTLIQQHDEVIVDNRTTNDERSCNLCNVRWMNLSVHECFIHDQHRWLSQHCSRYTNQLSLSWTEVRKSPCYNYSINTSILLIVINIHEYNFKTTMYTALHLCTTVRQKVDSRYRYILQTALEAQLEKYNYNLSIFFQELSEIKWYRRLYPLTL